MPWPKGKPRGPQSPEHIAKRMAAGAHAQKGVKQTAEHVEKGRQARIGKKLNVTPARAESMHKRWAEGVYDDLFKRKQDCFYGDVGMRSSWEVEAAAAFDAAGIAWAYEPRRFGLPSGHNYWPDFHLTELDVWVEVKGYCTPEAQAKFDEFVSLGHKAVMLRADTPREFTVRLASYVGSVTSGDSSALQSV